MFLGLPSTISIRDRKVMCDMHIRHVCLGHMAVEYVVQCGPSCMPCGRLACGDHV